MQQHNNASVSYGRAVRAAAIAVAVLSGFVLFQISHVPVLRVREGKTIRLEQGQRLLLHLDRFGSPAQPIRVQNDRPSVARIGSNLVLYARNPGDCTMQFISKNGDQTTCRISVGCHSGLLDRRTLQKYGAGKCRRLMIVAHPDDETLWGGAHLRGGNYFIVCLTNGNHPIRSREYRRVLKRSGSRGIILNYPDIYHGKKNDWSLVREGIRKDLEQIFRWKQWDQIVTYNPDGVTGHIHHRMTYADTVRCCKDGGLTDQLYYFGRYYPRGRVPDGLHRLNQKDLSFKQALVDLYPHEMHAIHRYWKQMIPYENWIQYRNWK